MRPSHSLRAKILIGLDLIACAASTSIPAAAIEPVPAVFYPILQRVSVTTSHWHGRRIPGLLKLQRKKRAESECSEGQDVCDDGGCCELGSFCYFSGCCTRQQVGCAQQACCPTGLKCCPDAGCCPLSHVCVPGGGCCPPGQSCIVPNNPPAVAEQVRQLGQQVPAQVASTPASSSSKEVQPSSTRKTRSSSAIATGGAPSSSAPTNPEDRSSTSSAATSLRVKSSSQESMTQSVTVLPDGQTVTVLFTSTASSPSASKPAPTAVSAAATPPIGPIIGTLIGIIVVILLVYWFVRRRLRNTEYDDNQPYWDVDDVPTSHGAQPMGYADHGSQLELIRRDDSGVASDTRHHGSSIALIDTAPSARSRTGTYHSDVVSDPSPATSYPPASISRSQSGSSRQPWDYGVSYGTYPPEKRQPITLSVNGRSNPNLEPAARTDSQLSPTQALPEHGVSLGQLTDMISQLQSEVSRLHVVGGKDDLDYIPPPVYEHTSPREV